MARSRRHSLDALNDKRSADKEKKDQERYDDLAGDLAVEFNKVLDILFPAVGATDDPDFDNFKWNSAEEFLENLRKFTNGSNPDAQTKRQGKTPDGASASPTPVAATPAAPTPAPAPTPGLRGRVGQRVKKMYEGN